MRNATHQEAVAALIANVSLIKLLVRHDPPPKGLQVRITNLSFVILVFQSCYMGMYWQKERTFSASNNIVFHFWSKVIFLFINKTVA